MAGGKIPPAAGADIAGATDRLIVRLRDPVAREPERRIAEVGGRLGERLQHLRTMSGHAQVVRLSARISRNEAMALARRVMNDPAVAYAEPDLRMKPLRVPNDALYPQQWHYFEPAGGINLPAAWDVTTGSAAITVAVIDTGVRPHADLAGRLVAGYDFITDVPTANDADGRDADASDPGDWGCDGAGNSSWHGTHVAGTLGATSNNGSGVAGVNWGSKVQPVRVLGRCGGYTSDIADGMRWAAGISVPGIPANATPARVLNLSLGGAGNCGNTFQNAINDVLARGAVVVVAAGNSNVDATGTAPANCAGVIAVSAVQRNGGKAGYSNFGPKVTIAAPGGGAGGGVISTLNAGASVPAADNYASYQGTSMATPHVAGVVSLMLSANPALTPAQVTAMLQASARAFPTGTGSDCTAATCGAGIVDAAAALAAAVPAPPPDSGRVNLALASSGAVATASSSYGAAFGPSGANDGDRRGRNWGAGGGWNDATANVWADWLQVDFGSVKTVAEIDVFSVQDSYANPQEPTDTATFSQFGLTDFEVQHWTGSMWQTVPGGSVTGNNKVWRKFAFAPVSTSRIRVLVLSAGGGYSRMAELEAYAVADTTAPAPRVNVALAANGGNASASSAYSAAFSARGVNDGDRRGSGWGSDRGWNDATPNAFPDVLQVDFNGVKTVSEVGVFSVQDDFLSPAEPTEASTFTRYGVTDFDVQAWDGGAWVTVSGGSVTGNNRVWRKLTFTPVATSSIRVVVRGSRDGYSRLVELEAWAEASTTPPPAPTHINVALAANGASASVSSAYSSAFSARGVNDGDRRGAGWGSDGGWNDATVDAFPDIVQIDFNGMKTLTEIDVVTVQDQFQTPAEPTESTTFTRYGITDFDVQTWNGTAWVGIPGGSVTSNNRVLRKFTFSPISTNAVRVVVRASADGYSRVVEVEAWSPIP